MTARVKRNWREIAHKLMRCLARVGRSTPSLMSLYLVLVGFVVNDQLRDAAKDNADRAAFVATDFLVRSASAQTQYALEQLVAANAVYTGALSKHKTASTSADADLMAEVTYIDSELNVSLESQRALASAIDDLPANDPLRQKFADATARGVNLLQGDLDKVKSIQQLLQGEHDKGRPIQPRATRESPAAGDADTLIVQDIPKAIERQAEMYKLVTADANIGRRYYHSTYSLWNALGVELFLMGWIWSVYQVVAHRRTDAAETPSD